jgi:hypothetical protein
MTVERKTYSSTGAKQSKAVPAKRMARKNKLLKDAGVLSLVEKEDVNRMRHRIDSLVREIDECIALMTNE